MNFSFHEKWDNTFIVLLAVILFLPFLGGVHLFDWDEINFAECSREMLLTGDYLRLQIDYRPFYEKPPLFIWLQVISMKIWGINEYGARFPNAVAGIVTLLLVYRLGKSYRDRQLGWLWVLCYTGSLLPYFYFKSGIIDPVFNLFIFLGIWQLSEPKLKNTIWAGVFTGLAVLTKGPVALLLVMLTWLFFYIYQFINKLRAGTHKWQTFITEAPYSKFLVYICAVLLISGSWFAADYIKNGPDFLQKFITYQIRLFSTHDAGHKGFPGYHFVILLIGCFPASVFSIQYLIKKGINEDKIFWLKSLFWVVLILFSIVQSKIVHYSSACYLPLTFFAALTIDDIAKNKMHLYPALSRMLAGIGVLLVLIIVLLPFLGNNTDLLKPYLAKDPFAMGNLEATVNWTYLICLPGIFLVLIIIARKYWMSKIKYYKSAILFLLGTTIFTTWIILLLPSRIEAYSQRAAINFYKSKSGEAGYVAVYGFKSYAHLFYAQKPPKDDKGVVPSNQELLYSPITKPVYVVCKINHLERLLGEIKCREIKRENGFVFLVRE